MENKFIPYPKQIKVGGQRIEVRDVERCDDDNAGMAFACSGYVEIADKFRKEGVQSPDSKRNTFFPRNDTLHTLQYGRVRAER